MPWLEDEVEEALQRDIMGTSSYTPGDLCRKLGMDGFGAHYPLDGGFPSPVAAENRHEGYYFPKHVTFDFRPPWVAEMAYEAGSGRSYVKRGLLSSRDSLRLMDEFLPDPDHPERYARVSQWITEYRGEFAVFARIRFGAAPTLLSMGLDHFAYATKDDPLLIHESIDASQNGRRELSST